MTVTGTFAALLAASCAMALLLMGVSVTQRYLPSRSGHIRYQLVAHAIAAGVILLAAILIIDPKFLAGFSASAAEALRVRAHGETSLQLSMIAAGKAALTDMPAEVPQSPAPLWISVAMLVWIGGACYRLGRIVHRRLRAASLVRAAAPLDDRRVLAVVERIASQTGLRQPAVVRSHPSMVAPALVGVIRPALIFPDGFEHAPAREIEMVLLHELAHLRRRDGMATLVMELAAACFWFHPLVARAARQARDLQEIAADSHVLAAGVPASRYAQYLLDVFQRYSDPAMKLSEAHAITGPCLIETRLHSILDQATHHAPPTRRQSMGLSSAFVLIVCLLAALPVALSGGQTVARTELASHEPDPALLNQSAIDSLIREAVIDKMADRYLPGSAVVVVSGDRIIYKQGFGHREVFHEVPVDVDRTIWRIGSITKVLTGIAALQLVDAGRLSLEADVNSYLTDFKVPAAFGQPIRLRHLLTHSAGFDQPGTQRHAASAGEVVGLSNFLSQNLRRIRPPGELAVYDTYGIVLAGHLVELRSGIPYEQYLRQRIFEPLEMHRSSITVRRALMTDVAVGYEFAGHYEAMPWEFMNTNPASTANATAVDMGNLMIMLLNGGEFKGERILSRQSVQAMFTRQFANDPDQPGYGFTLWEDRSFGLPAWSHGGSMTGYAAFLYLIPDHRIGIFIANNLELPDLANKVIATLVPALFPATSAPPMRAPFAEGEPVTRFAGTYASAIHNHGNPDQGWRRHPFEVTVNQEGELVFNNRAATRVGPDAFQLKDGSLITFRENTRKQITHMFVNQAVFERLK